MPDRKPLTVEQRGDWAVAAHMKDSKPEVRPCRKCGAKIEIILVSGRNVAVDIAAPVYHIVDDDDRKRLGTLATCTRVRVAHAAVCKGKR